MAAYVAPSIKTIEEFDLWPFVRRALGLLGKVKEIEKRVWSVNGHIIRWDGAGFLCDCFNWEVFHVRQGGFCKHSLAVCLRSKSYRDRILQALEKEEVRSG